MSWNIVHTTQIFITIFETIYCLLSFPINMFCSPFASWSGSFQLAENMGYVQSFLCCMTTLSIYVGSNQLLGHFHPEIQQVISCFQSNVFVILFKISKAFTRHTSTYSKRKTSSIFGWSADRILSTVLHTSVYSTHVFLVGGYWPWWRTHDFKKISTPSATNNWTISEWRNICT